MKIWFWDKWSWIAVVVFASAFLYGLIAWDSQKGAALFMKSVEFISKPISNELINQFHKIMESALSKK